MIIEASVMGLLRTVLILLLIYFGLKILARLLSPLLLRFVAKKAEEKFGQPFHGVDNNRYQNRQPQKEGETVIDKMPDKKKSTNDKVGEYIDYEEVD